jgi:hypothetical protein
MHQLNVCKRNLFGNEHINCEFLLPQGTTTLKMIWVLKQRPSFVNELSDVDMQKRYDACEQLLHVFETIPVQGKMVSFDE